MAEENAATFSDVKKALNAIGARKIAAQPFIKYYKGDHDFTFTSDKYRNKFFTRLKKFRDNLCKTVVNAPCDRLEVIGFADPKNKTVYNESWEVWKYSDMPRLEKKIYRDHFKTSDAFVVVWPDKTGQARIYPQDPSLCQVWRDPETYEIVRGAKLWRGLDDFIYLTLYYTDRVERYITKGKQSDGNIPNEAAFDLRKAEPGDEAFNETGVCPMFSFPREYSILDDIIPLQDALNKEFCDMLVSSEANALRQRWVAGINFPEDPTTGKKIIPFDQNSQWVAVNDVLGKFGEFADANLTEFNNTLDNIRMEISRISGLPAYYFMLEKGGFPSGEALSKAESRFTALISDAQKDIGEVWKRAVALAMIIDGKSVDTAQLETSWTPAAPTSLNEKLDQGEKKLRIGVSEEKVQAEIGYTEQEIADMKAQNAEKQKTATDAFGKAFAGGAIA